MEEVLFSLVRRGQEHPLLGQGVLAARVHGEHPFQGVQARARIPPLGVVLPPELRVQGFGHAPAVGEAELGEHGSRRQQAEVLHQIFAQETHGHRVQQDRALAREADDPAVRIQFEQFLVVQVDGAHGVPSAIGQA